MFGRALTGHFKTLQCFLAAACRLQGHAKIQSPRTALRLQFDGFAQTRFGLAKATLAKKFAGFLNQLLGAEFKVGRVVHGCSVVTLGGRSFVVLPIFWKIIILYTQRINGLYARD